MLFLNHEKNLILIHGQVTATISKFSPLIFETYFQLYGRVTTRENYTVGSSIFCKLYLTLFDFFNFYTSWASVFQKLNSRVVNWIGIPLFFRVRGKAQHSDPLPFLLEVNPWGCSMSQYFTGRQTKNTFIAAFTWFAVRS